MVYVDNTKQVYVMYLSKKWGKSLCKPVIPLSSMRLGDTQT